MYETIGDFLEQENGKEYLIIHFSPSSVPLKQRWRNNGLSADFLAEYWATFFPAYDLPSRNRQVEVKGAISYIANELLENLMKFSYDPAGYPVSLELYLYENEFRFYARNAVEPQSMKAFQARAHQLLTEDTYELYIQQVEQNARDDTITESNLGLLTMINDYHARLAWKFATIPHEGQEVAVVTTMVRLAV